MFKTFARKPLAALAITGAALIGVAAQAQSNYPERPVTMVIPLGAGGSHDLNARVITSIIPSYLGQAMVVQLSPGAGGQQGTQEVANAPADGYTLLFTHNYIDQLQQHVENLPYDPLEDFETVVRVNYAPIAIAVHADSEYQTMDDLIAASQENPGGIQMAHSGNWGALFVPAVQIMQALDMEWNLVPYQGGGPALQALLSRDADVTMGFPSSLTSHMEAGTVRVLATAGDERIYEDVPSFSEIGVEGDVGFMHRVVLAPSGTPEEAMTTLQEAFAALEADQTFNQMMGRLGENINIIPGDEYDEMRANQSQAYEQLVNDLTSQ